MSKSVQRGNGKHDRVEISGSHLNIQHVKSDDTKYGDQPKITTETWGNDEDREYGRTTVHGNDQTNYHDSHKQD